MLRFQEDNGLTCALALATCLALPGCSDGATTEQPASDPGLSLTREAYGALKRADYEATPDLIARLDAAFEANPGLGRVAFYAGTMRLWRATGGSLDPVQQLPDVLGAIEKFEQARSLRPGDPHAAAFLGIAQMALGNVVRDEARIDTGYAVLEESVRLYPPYVNGVRTQAMGLLPRGHRYFPEALAAMYGTFSACGFDGAPDSDLSLVAYPTEADEPLSTCWNGGIVEHVWEGIFLVYGDVLVKNGEPARGRQLYEVAKKAPNYDRWLFADVLEARIRDADTRAALYLDADAANDPPTWMDGKDLCVGCHASKP